MLCKKRAQKTVQFARNKENSEINMDNERTGEEKRGSVRTRETCKGASSLIDSQQIFVFRCSNIFRSSQLKTENVYIKLLPKI